ncbi:hypothetical protein [Allobranchiibius huperziae]|uniref:Heme/copper-type cytochrome/quinol oxidase subunit 1 n=1 Tax=Allobranchiibius huperziae TaxID=1874116 RepID=A0A853D7G7_9MICO|nr:hypothetical protein [Allobranchiibius huperziae]NYJ73082.1 heme/copper-type cytochrome/quinol oxidase subunit 1 [Allobranchiibius huperziae]
MMRRAWWVLGLVLVGGGIALALSSQAGPSDFGWFAYAPLDDGSGGRLGTSGSWWDGSASIVTRWQIVGCAVAVIGLMVLAAGIGFRLGRRRASPEERV